MMGTGMAHPSIQSPPAYPSQHAAGTPGNQYNNMLPVGYGVSGKVAPPPNAQALPDKREYTTY